MGVVLVKGRERVGKVYCHDIYSVCVWGGGGGSINVLWVGRGCILIVTTVKEGTESAL